MRAEGDLNKGIKIGSKEKKLTDWNSDKGNAKLNVKLVLLNCSQVRIKHYCYKICKENIREYIEGLFSAAKIKTFHAF